MLDKERLFYAAHVQEWAQIHQDKYVLIKDDKLIGIFDTIDDALSAGASQFGLSSFLVRRIGELEQTISIPALTLGVLRANT